MALRTLMLMRHAKSDWSEPGTSDHDRPLNARGRKTAPAMGQHFVALGVEIDVLLVSSAARAQETLRLLQSHWGQTAVVWNVPSLYLASPHELIRQIEGLHDDWQQAMLIGHNPGLSILASQLAQQDIELPTAAVAKFACPATTWLNAVSTAAWELQAFWKPKELGAA